MSNLKNATGFQMNCILGAKGDNPLVEQCRTIGQGKTTYVAHVN